MNVQCRFHNGVVVLEGGLVLPEGTPVTVFCPPTVVPPVAQKERVDFPLVHAKEPGSLHLTNEQIAEIFDEEDVSS